METDREEGAAIEREREEEVDDPNRVDVSHSEEPFCQIGPESDELIV